MVRHLAKQGVRHLFGPFEKYPSDHLLYAKRVPDTSWGTFLGQQKKRWPEPVFQPYASAAVYWIIIRRPTNALGSGVPALGWATGIKWGDFVQEGNDPVSEIPGGSPESDALF
jgi:hypothetical protein